MAVGQAPANIDWVVRAEVLDVMAECRYSGGSSGTNCRQLHQFPGFPDGLSVVDTGLVLKSVMEENIQKPTAKDSFSSEDEKKFSLIRGSFSLDALCVAWKWTKARRLLLLLQSMCIVAAESTVSFHPPTTNSKAREYFDLLVFLTILALNGGGSGALWNSLESTRSGRGKTKDFTNSGRLLSTQWSPN